MPHELPSLAPEVLYPRRLAWRALSAVLEERGLSAITLKLNPDDPRNALPGNVEGEVIFGEDLLRRYDSRVTWVTITGTSARVVVPDVWRLVRRNHVKGFDPREVGIVPRRGVPDIDTEVDLGEVIEREGELMRNAPQRPIPPASAPARPAGAIRAFGSSGRGD